MKKKGRATMLVLFTCCISWPIIKAALRVFNNESIEEYYQRSYIIATRNATSKELPTTVSKTFIHLCPSHVMNIFLEGQEGTSKELKEHL